MDATRASIPDEADVDTEPEVDMEAILEEVDSADPSDFPTSAEEL